MRGAFDQYEKDLRATGPKQGNKFGRFLGSALAPMAIGALAGGNIGESAIYGLGSAAGNYQQNKELTRGIEEKIANARFSLPGLEQAYNRGEVDIQVEQFKMMYPQYFSSGMNPGATAKKIATISQVSGAKPGTPEFDEAWNKYASSGDQQLYGHLGANPDYLDFLANRKRNEKFGLEMGTLDASVETYQSTILPGIEADLQNAKDLLVAIENGKYNETGPIEGRLKKYWSTDVAELEARGVMQALKALQITKLIPVSNFEIAMVSSMYADIARDPEANKGKMKFIIGFYEEKLKAADEAYKFYRGNDNSMVGFESKTSKSRRSGKTADDYLREAGGG